MARNTTAAQNAQGNIPEVNDRELEQEAGKLETMAQNAQGAGMDQLAGDKGVQLSVRDLDDVLQEEGLTWKEWNETVQAKKKAASLMTISGPELLEADPSVKILEEDGTVYMISGQALPYMITNMEDACEMLYRLLPLLGRKGNENFIPTLRIRRGEDHIYLFREAAEGNAYS